MQDQDRDTGIDMLALYYSHVFHNYTLPSPLSKHKK